MKIMMNTKWTLNDALEYIRELQPKFKEMNLHLALAGSVLNNGESNNDLDIIVLGMHNNEPLLEDKLIEFFGSINATRITDKKYELENRILYRSFYGENSNQIDWFVYDIREEDKE